MLSLSAAVSVAATDRGQERIVALLDVPAPGFAEHVAERIAGDDVAQLSAQLVKLRSEVRLLALENQAIGVKLARFESDHSSITTASLPEPARHAERPVAEPRQAYPPIPAPRASPGATAPLAGTAHFALEIGSGATRDELDALWDILSTRHDSVLDGLVPTFAVVSGEDGRQRLLLRAGPIDDATVATTACAALRERGTACSPVSEHRQAPVIP